jgi:hypothetical protein
MPRLAAAFERICMGVQKMQHPGGCFALFRVLFCIKKQRIF